MKFDYDLFVIGAGSGGVRASRMAADFGAKVAIVEERYLGGTCVNVGCVPKKLFVYGSHYSSDLMDAKGYGWSIKGSHFNWNILRDNKTQEIKRLNGVYQAILQTAGVILFTGHAQLVDAHTVQVNHTFYTAERILIATGSWPQVPAFPGSDHVVTSNEIFCLDNLPQKAVIVGGGYIAVEFASILAGLGVETTQMYRGPLFLRGFDQEVRQCVADELKQKNIQLLFNTSVHEIKKINQQLVLYLVDGKAITTDLVLYATGRTANTQHLGLEKVGVQLDQKGAIIVNDQLQTSVSSIYALGDVINRAQLTPVALAEAMAFAKNIYGKQSVKMDYAAIPTAVFCQPTIASVGLTEEDARKHCKDIEIYKTQFRPMKHTMTGRKERTFIKLVVDKASDKVIGAHMVGAEAGEIMQGIAVAIRAGATKAIFDSTIGIHPTAAEEFVSLREATTT